MILKHLYNQNIIKTIKHQRDTMSPDLQIMDMTGATSDRSTVITNFVNMLYNQLKDSTCRGYPDNVQYRWKTSQL